MNKNALIMGIIWICVALAGTFFLIKGLTMNGSNFENKDKWKNAEIVKDFMGDDEMDDEMDNEIVESGERTLKTGAECIFDAEELNLIKVECHSAGLIYNLSNDGKIHVNALGTWEKHQLPKVECGNGTLFIKTPRPKIMFFVPSFSKKEIEILVPAECLSKNTVIKSSCASGSTKIDNFDVKNIQIESASGSISINSSCADKISLESASGSTKFDDCSFGYVQIESASGSLNLSGKYEQFNIESASGSIKIENDIALTKDSSIEAVSGSITLLMPEDSNYNLVYQSVSGRFSDELTGTSGGRNGSVVKGDGSVKIKIESVSGSIKILKN